MMNFLFFQRIRAFLGYGPSRRGSKRDDAANDKANHDQQNVKIRDHLSAPSPGPCGSHLTVTGFLHEIATVGRAPSHRMKAFRMHKTVLSFPSLRVARIT